VATASGARERNVSTLAPLVSIGSTSSRSKPAASSWPSRRLTALFKREVAAVLVAPIRTALGRNERVIIVTDAVVGPSGVPRAERAVDSACSCDGFYGRAQSYSVTYGSGLLLATSLCEILDELGLPFTPWLGGGPLPASGLVITETNPTTSMALALPMADRTTLPTRKVPLRLADGTRVRAKSDWYWRLGAAAIAAEILEAPSIREERHHERVAGLWCLALARQLEKGTESGAGIALLGDADGTYLVGDVDPSWIADVERVGVRWGAVHQTVHKIRVVAATPEETIDLSAAAPNAAGAAPADPATSDDDDLRGNVVT